MFCSTIIPTIGRATLSRAVESVLQQSIPNEDFETIVINDSGKDLPDINWQRSRNLQILNTNRRERSVARNAGAAIAKGRYLHFLDDDDWLAPNAYQSLNQLSQTSTAKWLYGMTQLVDRRSRPTIQLRHGLNGNCLIHAMAGEWIPLQSSWIDREMFMKVGGFNPLLIGPEDIDLLRRILLHESIAETPHLIAYVTMGGEGSTTDYVHHPRASRRARERVLDEPDSYARMHASVADSFWKGRMLRVYLTSAAWNLKRRQFFTAASRVLASLLGMLMPGPSLFARNFWRALLRPYASPTFEKGIQRARKAS